MAEKILVMLSDKAFWRSGNVIRIKIMHIRFFLSTILFLTKSISFGQLSAEDYRVYTAIIKTEIHDSTKSVAIIKNGIDSIDKNKNTFGIADQLASKNFSDRRQLYSWTENKEKVRPSILDSNSIQLLMDYCKSSIHKFILADNFNSRFKTIMLEKFPIRRKSIQKDWKVFYEKYPGSDGIFSFSQIKYYTQDKIAIVYYWVRRHGLNGHGALASLTKIKGEWQMEYKTYLWWN